MIWVECKTDEVGQRALMVKDPIAIGRAATCEFSFPQDKEVSRVHATIELRGKHWYLVDHKSTNGSYVNGQRVTVPFPLKEGDAIEVGAQLLRVVGGLDFSVTKSEAPKFAGYPHLYVLLKVDPEASQAEIEEAYACLTKIFDPELHPGNKFAPVLLKEIVDAYEVLSNPSRRENYNATLTRNE